MDDLNIIETLEELPKTVDYLKEEFEMKDLEETKFLPLVATRANGTHIHQSTYTENVLIRFYIDKAHPLYNNSIFGN